MPALYVNTTASARVADHPRAIYRVVIERRAFYALDYLTRFVTWPGVVLSVVENSASVAGFPISSPEKGVEGDDTVAVIDYRAGSHPGAAVVSDIVTAVDESSKYISVKSITRLDPVPAESAGGASAFDASRDGAQTIARDQAESESIFTQLTANLKSAGKFVVIVAAIAGVALVLYYVPRRAPTP